MKSLSLAILMGVILSLAVFAQASSKDIVVPSGHPAADLKAYDKYEDVLDRIEAYLAELQKIRSGIALKDNR
jgi:hypothetical protein